ncbi:MAG: bifunctional adenosylcobinamide kinase/adenosylcobinamide-phosphate guanylyltransferase [Elusimicrobiota bacterium]|nr:bifunctional adenosylcobinamide kinase/adenosylcobinamide-phosphate guanylyltransferase [Elusimicrobiota bacterium]
MSNKSKIIFIIGGIRSGKTSFAIKLAKKYSKSKLRQRCQVHPSRIEAGQGRGKLTIYIATGIKTDKEMKQRIIEHKNLRPKDWQTIEEPIELNKVISRLKKCVVIIDCVNFWVRNLLMKKYSSVKIFSLLEDCLKLIKKSNIVAILVSNEIGLSPVAPYKSGRIFQDILGKVNQIVSTYSDEVYFLVSGLPMELKK